MRGQKSGKELSVDELAEFCGVSQSTVSRWITKAELPAKPGENGVYSINSLEFRAWDKRESAVDPRAEKAKLDRIRRVAEERKLEKDEAQYVLDVDQLADYWLDLADQAGKRLRQVAVKMSYRVAELTGYQNVSQIERLLQDAYLEALRETHSDSRIPVPGGHIPVTARAERPEVGRS